MCASFDTFVIPMFVMRWPDVDMNVPDSTGRINFHSITEEKGVGFLLTEYTASRGCCNLILFINSFNMFLISDTRN